MSCRTPRAVPTLQIAAESGWCRCWRTLASRGCSGARRVAGLLLCTACLAGVGNAHALGDQWYLGMGGGASWLQPNPVDRTIDLEERQGQLGTLIIGGDVDERSSAQIQLYGMGEAMFDNGETVPYFAGDASILYRFFDSRDRKLRGGGFGAAFYGRFGLGFIERDSELDLSNDSGVYFGAGGGLEIFLNNSLSLRAEGFYHESDAASATVSLVARFGGAAARPAPSPSDRTREQISPPNATTDDVDASKSLAVPVPSAPAPPPVVPPTISTAPATPSAPEPATAPRTLATASDVDGDGVQNTRDACAESAAGYPVRPNGCPLFDGILSGVTFIDATAELADGATEQLDFLADLLLRYPVSRIEILAHTDSRGSVRDQAILTRARLKSVGTYLLRKGIRSNRLVLRSFGGTQPLFDNGTVDGQRRNNRIEVIEYLK